MDYNKQTCFLVLINRITPQQQDQKPKSRLLLMWLRHGRCERVEAVLVHLQAVSAARTQALSAAARAGPWLQGP